MSLLESIIHGKKIMPRRIMLYGVHGIGKSSWAACATKPVFICAEEGLNDIGSDRFDLCQNVDDLLKQVACLYTDKHEYKTVVVDTLDALEKLVWLKVCSSRGVKNIEDIGYGKGYSFAVSVWDNILSGFQALRDDRGMQVILLAHSTISRFENPETQGYDRFSPKLHKTASSLVQEWCDEVLFASYKVYTKTESEGGFAKVKTKGIGSGERVIRTEERPAHAAKNRMGLPYEISLDYADFSKYLPTHQSQISQKAGVQ